MAVASRVQVKDRPTRIAIGDAFGSADYKTEPILGPSGCPIGEPGVVGPPGILTAADVTAIIPTRGNLDMDRIRETLPYGEIIIRDDSVSGSLGCFGRYEAAREASNDVIYFQDDDVLFTNHDALLAAYDPNRLVANMPDPWYTHAYKGYDMVLPGFGSLCPRGLWDEPFARYLDEWPLDEQFLTWADMIFGALAPGTRVDLGGEALPSADDEGRICTTPGSEDRKWVVMQRAFALRDAK